TSWNTSFTLLAVWRRTRGDGSERQQLTLDVAAQAIGLGFLRIGRTNLVERRERLVQVPAGREPFGARERFLAPARQRQADLTRDRRRGPRARWIARSERPRHVHERVPVDPFAPRGIAAETERDEAEKRRDHDATGGRHGRRRGHRLSRSCADR